MRSLPLCATALAAALLLAGCSGDGPDIDPAPATATGGGSITLTFPPPADGTTAEVPDTDTITASAERDLCDTLAGEIAGWQEQGGTAAKVSFNTTVQGWAARNGGLNDIVVRDNAVVDTITAKTCPEVRQQALAALGISDLASGLVGFGN
ncbi:hypothetical protein [Nocardia sp. NPDC057353]|uniref:hypothetical protein n=1 Tax=Nocardia sp. NPDC057353 TaxID=3346104 RepID=UPI00363E8963